MGRRLGDDDGLLPTGRHHPEAEPRVEQGADGRPDHRRPEKEPPHTSAEAIPPRSSDRLSALHGRLNLTKRELRHERAVHSSINTDLGASSISKPQWNVVWPQRGRKQRAIVCEEGLFDGSRVGHESVAGRIHHRAQINTLIPIQHPVNTSSGINLPCVRRGGTHGLFLNALALPYPAEQACDVPKPSRGVSLNGTPVVHINVSTIALGDSGIESVAT